jgi:transaldolase/glucose-6-phosphate isomerase
VIDAYMSGLEQRLAKGLPIAQIHSVASFFVSRVDTLVDKLLEEKGAAGKELQGKIAVANAKEAYQVFLAKIATPRWKALEAQGATRQRPLWASTGTKNKAYSDVLYVEPLIGRDTVNTMPLATLIAFNDHGKVADTIGQGVPEARAQLKRLGELGIDLEKACAKLTVDGLELFSKAFEALLKALADRSEAQRSSKAMKVEERLGKRQQDAEAGLAAAAQKKAGSRLWARDATLWGDDPKHVAVAKNRLGWLEVTKFVRQNLAELSSFANEAAQRFDHCVLLGMGGSSLCPDVLGRVLGKQRGGLDLRVLDSTAPDAVRDVVKDFDLARTLFLVSSKSGGTTEVNCFYKHFRAEVERQIGAATAGSHFVAITDNGSPLHQLAKTDGFWRTWVNPGDIGGRYSALSWFGLVPAALLGLDVGRMLDEADKVAHASSAQVPLKENLAVRLGAILGGCANGGAEKLTLLLSKELAPFGGWVEQLVAESTGKSGKGIVPVDGEPYAAADKYGDDRVFVAMSFASEKHDAGPLQPLVQWQVPNRVALAGEFLRWEIATAIAGAVTGVDPFDEPNVTESKEKTRALLATGKLPPLEPSLRAGGLALFASGPHSAVLKKAAATLGADKGASPAHWIAAHLALGEPHDYVALLAYLPPSDELRKQFSELQGRVRDATRLAVTFGFGPRFLHSTGQLHKGGPNNGVFLQATSDGGADLPIPGELYGFATLFAAQARGDLEVLQARGRRALRVHVEDGDSNKIIEAVREAVRLLAR